MSRLFAPLPIAERGFPCNVLATRDGNACYSSGNAIVLSQKDQPQLLVNHHQAKVTALAFSPSGAWIASGDSKGQVKIWASRGERLVKYEYKLLVGCVRGICWSPDNRRIAVCGGDPSKGGESVCVAFDTGSRVGDLSGHSKSITSIAYRPIAPFRIITGGEDTSVIFFEGPPFKFMKSHQTAHTSFVNSVAFSVDGSRAFSCGSDGIVAEYTGDTGDLISRLDPKLSCSIWGLSVIKNGSLLAIACGDKRVRLLETGNMTIFAECQIGNGELKDMPMGIGSDPLGPSFTTISLDGSIREYESDENEIIRLRKTIWGSHGSITAILRREEERFTVCGSDGSVWSFSKDVSLHIPKVPIKASAGIGLVGDSLVGIAAQHDGKVVSFDGSELPSTITIPPTTSRLVQSGRTCFAIGNKNSEIRELGGNRTILIDGTISVFGLSPDGQSIVYNVEKSRNMSLQAENRELIVQVGNNLVKKFQTQITNADIVCAAINDEGIVAVASASQELHAYLPGEAGGYTVVEQTVRCWTYHKAKITCMQWLQGRSLLVTASLDKNIYVWDLSDPTNGPVASLKDIHRDGVSSLVAYCTTGSEITIVSGGIDGSVRVSKLNV
jgi:WD40 repeat protein